MVSPAFPSSHPSHSPIPSFGSSTPLISSLPSSSSFHTLHPWHTDALTSQLVRQRKSTEELALLRKQRGRKANALIQFYRNQNKLIDEYLTPLVDYNPTLDLIQSKKITFAIRASLGANVLLFCLQAAAAIFSQSLSLFATATDSFMDLFSGVILVFTDWASSKKNPLDYPTGKKRYQTAGLICFACVMFMASIQLFVAGIKAFIAGPVASGSHNDIKEVVFISIALAVKTSLFIYCFMLRKDAAARTLMKDHQNDLLVNGFGLIMFLLGSHIVWWADPMGCLLIALLILQSWVRTAWENVQLIVGRSAPPSVLNKLTYLAATHHPAILHVDTIKAYALGHRWFVEVDIVLHPEVTLRFSHDIGETLQTKLEGLESVERAFVHCDYEFTHAPEHCIKM